MKKFFSDSILLTLGGLVNRTKGFIFIPIIVSYVGLQGYGAYTQIIINILMLKAVFSLELGSGFQRFVPGLNNHKRKQALHFYTVLFPTLLLGSLGMLGLYLSATWLNSIFFEGHYLLALQFSAPILLSGVVYANCSKFFLAIKKFKIYTTFTFFYDLLPYLAFIAGIMLTEEVMTGVMLYMLTDALVVLIMVLVIMFELPLGRFSAKLCRQYLQYTYALSLGSIEGGLLDKVDRYFISFFLGIESLGVYNIIYKICSVSDFITTPIKKQLLSYLAGVWDKGHQLESKKTIEQALLLFLALSIGFISFLTINIEEVFNLLLQDQVTQIPLPWMVLLIGAGVIAYASKRFYNLLMQLEQRTSDELKYQTIGLLLNVVLNALLIPTIGIIGAALATFVSYLIMIIIIQARYQLQLEATFWWHVLSFMFIAAGVIFTYHLIFDGRHILLLGANATLSALTYLALVLIIKKNMLLEMKSSMLKFRKLV